ncbi:MAG: hypothetical protein ACREM6_00785, partial [Vulcanimicrobiaceae bacterium]
MKARSEGLQVMGEAENGLLGLRPAPPTVVDGGNRALVDLARAVEDDLARPDLAASTERAYAHDWADFAAFCRRHALQA